MCVVSMVSDHFDQKWRDRYPNYPWQAPIVPLIPRPKFVPPANPPEPWVGIGPIATPFDAITREEFDELKRDVADLKELLKRAKKYDADNGEPDCEIEDKTERPRTIARLVGIDLDEVIRGG